MLRMLVPAGLILGLASAVPVCAAPGDADLAFGVSPGYTRSDFGLDEAGQDIAVDAQGRLVVAVSALDGGGIYSAYLVRYLADGALDTSFGSGGRAMPAPMPPNNGNGNVLRIGSTLYHAIPAGDRVHVYAWRDNGQPETAFGPGGHAEVAFAGGQVYPVLEMAAQGTALVVALGARNPASGVREGALFRLTPAGALDTTFGSGGIAWSRAYAGAAASNRYTGLARTADGKLVAGGRAGPDSATQNYWLTRFNANGTVDTAFGHAGQVVLDLGPVDLGRRLALQADGRIVLGGVSCAVGGSGCQPRIARFLANGAVDTSFGSNGVFAITYNQENSQFDLMLDGGGRVVAVGDMSVGAAGRTGYVLRLTPAGQLDTTFGGIGTVRYNYGPGGQAGAYSLLGVARYGTQYVLAGSARIAVDGVAASDAVVARIDG